MLDTLNFFFSALLLGIIIGEVIWLTYFGLKTKQTAKVTKPFIYEHQNPVRRILMVGDSIVLGVGASNPSASLAGRIAGLYPKSTLISRGIPGSTTSSVISLIEEPSETTAKWDSIIIFSGGMDVVHFVPYTTYAQNLSQIFVHAKKHTDNIIYIAPPNVGLAPIFPFPVSSLYTHGSRKLSMIAQEITKQYGVTCVQLFHETLDDHFKNKPHLYSADLSHPNDEGYEVWFMYIKNILQPL